MSVEAAMIQEGAQAAESVGGIAALGINGKLFFAQAINFIVVLFVFWKWIYKPIVVMLDRRSAAVEKQLQQGKEVEERLFHLEKERVDVLDTARVEAHRLLEEMKTVSAVRSQEMIEKAKQEVAVLVQEGRVSLAREKRAMVEEARKEVADLAVEIAAKVLGSSVDRPRSQTLAETFLADALVAAVPVSSGAKGNRVRSKKAL
ncbi:MAG TPA: F0F1 ATP synthase subunit B [Patescibacteria group bacterium]|nr:F0F1 ATP synthase subunit B [Patescibacteria group bacterium]